MEEAKEKLRKLVEKGDEFIPAFGMSLQKKVSQKTAGLIQNFHAIDLEYIAVVIHAVIEEIEKIGMDGTVKPPNFLAKWFRGEKKANAHELHKQFELVYPKVESQLKELERNQYKLMREIIVYKKEEKELLAMETELSLSVQATECMLAEVSGDTHDALTKRLYGLTLSKHLLQQTSAQVSLMRMNMEQAQTILQQTITSTVPLWKQQVLQLLGNIHHAKRKRPLTEEERDKLIEIQEKQEGLLKDLERIQQIARSVRGLQEKKE